MHGSARERAAWWHHGNVNHEHQSTQGDVAVADNPGASRYELTLGGKVAGYAEYRMQGDALRFTHTVVDPAHEGKGYGSKLAKFALDDVKRRGLKALPQCRFIADYIARHEREYGALVAR